MQEALQRRHFIEVQKRQDAGRFGGVVDELLRRHVQRDVRLDGHEPLGQRDVVLRRAELRLLARRQLGQMRVDPLHGTVLAQQFCGPDGPHALHPRHVVRRISADREDIDDLRGRRDLPLPAHLRHAQQFVLSPALARLELPGARRHQLAVILVGRNHIYFEALGLETARGRADHVVRLETRQHQHRDVQGLHDPGQRLQRLHHEGGRLAAVGLVLRVEFIAEGAARRVETHGDVRRTLAVDEFEQILGKSEKDGGIHAFRVDHGPAQEGIVHLEDERVAVDQKKFHGAKMKLFGESFKYNFQIRVYSINATCYEYVRICLKLCCGFTLGKYFKLFENEPIILENLHVS